MPKEHCRLIGSSFCLCGEGKIFVEFCNFEDQPPRNTDGRYRNTMTCAKCSEKFFFFQEHSGEMARLSSKDEFAAIQAAKRNWDHTLNEIETYQAFKELSDRLRQRLDKESKGSRYELLRDAALFHGSIDQLRNRPYRLPAILAGRAADFLGFYDPRLTALIDKLEEIENFPSDEPSAYITGNPGLLA